MDNAVKFLEECRSIEYQGEWYYSMVDCMRELSGSAHPRRYWNERKGWMFSYEGVDVYAIGVRILPLPNTIGTSRDTDCGNIVAILRVIQSMQGPQVDAVKLWIAERAAEAMYAESVHR